MRFHLDRLALLIISIIGLTTPLISCENRAPPMDGICEDVIPIRYDGVSTKNIQRCTWKYKIWNCWYDPPVRDWICDFISIAPIEQTKMEPAK